MVIPEPDREKYGHMPERLYWEMLEGEDPDDRAIREAHGIGYDVPYSDDVVCRNGCGLTYLEISSGKVHECERGPGPIAIPLSALCEKPSREAATGTRHMSRQPRRTTRAQRKDADG